MATVGKLDTVAKVDEAQGLVYGWASIVVTKAGDLVEDSQGDVIDPVDLDNAMIEFMLDHRAANEMHGGDPIGTVVESVVISPAKLEAMGFPTELAATAPVGAWIGVKMDPNSDTFARVRSGELQMFSIEGTGERVEI